MNESRRKLTQVVWITPIINSISLPIHAQTSVCTNADLSGNWQIVVTLNPTGVFNSTTTLNADGTGAYENTPPTPMDAGTVAWSVSNQEFSFLSTSTPSGVTANLPGTVDDNCSSIFGTYTNSVGNTGTYVMTKL